jgi:hypothetical protein
MVVLNGEQTGVDATKNTGCDINGKEVWTTRTNQFELDSSFKIVSALNDYSGSGRGISF